MWATVWLWSGKGIYFIYGTWLLGAINFNRPGKNFVYSQSFSGQWAVLPFASRPKCDFSIKCFHWLSCDFRSRPRSGRWVGSPCLSSLLTILPSGIINIFFNLKTVSQVMASNPIPPPHFKGFQRMNQETYIQNIFKYHSCIIDLVQHKHHNFNPAWRSSTTRALVQRGEAGKANLHGRPQRCNSSTYNPGSHRT